MARVSASAARANDADANHGYHQQAPQIGRPFSRRSASRQQIPAEEASETHQEHHAPEREDLSAETPPLPQGRGPYNRYHCYREDRWKGREMFGGGCTMSLRSHSCRSWSGRAGKSYGESAAVLVSSQEEA